MTTRTPWTAADYHPIIRLSGAAKLADSGVAPLVAAARGYSTITEKSEAKDLAERSSSVTGVRSLANTISRLVVDEEDVMLIPWYNAGRVAEVGYAAKHRSMQMRPSRPFVDERKGGKPMKYMGMPGEQTVLDFHPSTPIEWISSSLSVLMTEGVPKGDSALTAQLLASGITPEQLALPRDPADAKRLLHELMLTVPDDKRVTVISFVGVGTWRDHADDWRAIKVVDRKVLVAFDGDVATNYNVWKQANDLFTFLEGTKKAQPKLLNLNDVSVEAAKLTADMDPTEKVGLDDYLAKLGDWDDVLTLVVPSLPDAPERKESESHALGQWRVSPSRPYLVEEFAVETNSDGSKMPPKWTTRYEIAGRIIDTSSRRRPAQAEITSGQVDHDLDAELSDAVCTIEIAVKNPSGNPDDAPVLYRVSGPALLLAYPPSEWPRHGAIIPTEVLMNPEWPPRKGAEWMSAVKANRFDDVSINNGWDAMGWVPTDSGQPVYIVGSQVIGRNIDDDKRSVPGVTDRVLSGATDFGVMDNYFEISNDEWKKQTRDDIRTVLGAYIESGWWRDRKVASAAVAAMLRPTIPIRVAVTLYIHGAPRTGKTYTAAFIMAGWQKKAGVWGVHHLPGAADDTAASIEYAIARTPIWPADDLAPSVDRRASESQEASISRIIRSVHNHSTRRRMDPEMKQRQIALPSALFIVTAENEPQVDSIRERIIALETPRDAFSTDPAVKDRIEALGKSSRGEGGAPARLVAAMIRFWMFSGTGLGETWAEKIEAVRRTLETEVKKTAIRVLEDEHGISAGEATRHADQASDLALSFVVLSWLAEWAGIDENDPIMDRLGLGENSYAYDLFELAAGTVGKQRHTTPGRTLVKTLSKLMAGGRAHVENPVVPGAPPAPHGTSEQGQVHSNQLNRQLGWRYDAGREIWVPQGVSIGYYGVNDKGSRVILFEAVNAFREAQKNYPNFLPPGQTHTSSWASVWAENLAPDEYDRRAKTTTTQIRLGKDVTDGEAGSRVRLGGVPVLLDAVLNPTFDPTGEGRFGADEDE